MAGTLLVPQKGRGKSGDRRKVNRNSGHSLRIVSIGQIEAIHFPSLPIATRQSARTISGSGPRANYDLISSIMPPAGNVTRNTSIIPVSSCRMLFRRARRPPFPALLALNPFVPADLLDGAADAPRDSSTEAATSDPLRRVTRVAALCGSTISSIAEISDRVPLRRADSILLCKCRFSRTALAKRDAITVAIRGSQKSNVY